MKNIKDITISIFAIIGFVAIISGFTNQAEQSTQPTYGIPESHVFEIFRASDLTVFKLNKITGDVTGYYLSGGGKGTYKIYDSPKQVGE